MKFKGLQLPLERYVFPVVLLLYPFFGVSRGLDIADTTYNLANYRFAEGLDPMWYFSTFLGNLVGSIIMKLPGAGTMLGFGIYCTLLISAMALLSYYALKRWMPGWMIFIGEFISESLCWSPRVILYNYLTYFLMTVGVIFFLYGMFSWKRQNLLLFLAGACFGLNVLTRFPNILECTFIAVLIVYSAITKEKVTEALRKIGICVAGYIAGFGIPVLLISVRFGFSAYAEAISSLFSMTEGASDYSSGGMLSSIIEAYITTSKNMMIMIPCAIAGIIMFLMAKGRYVLIKKFAFIAGLLVLARYYFAQGVFTRNYYYYDCMFQVAMMFIIICVILSIIGALGLLNGSKEEQTLAFTALMLILITPIGSNNYTFPVLNNLFIAAPICLWLLRRLMQRLGEGEWNFPWQALATGVIVMLIVQGAIFHVRFSFADRDNKDAVLDTKITDIAIARGMRTTKENYDSLMELNSCIKDNGISAGKILVFGDIPGIPYIFDIDPAISTTWPDLDSFSVESFRTELDKLEKSKYPNPTVVMGADMVERANNSEKYDMLMDYIGKHDYNIIFESDRFTVYAALK